MPVCRKCSLDKAENGFYRSDPNNCRECIKASARAYRAANLERVRAYDRSRSDQPHRKAAVRARAVRYVALHGEIMRRDRQEHPEKYLARAKVQRAVKAGHLKVLPCERCAYVVGVHAHHEDYSKPLEVIWLCQPCHGQRHREINAERRQRAA